MSPSLQFSSMPEMQISPTTIYQAVMETDVGSITIELDAKRALQTVNNFVFLSNQSYYEEAPFHRVIQGFMVQGGDPTGTGRGGPGYNIPDEFPTWPNPYEIGTLAMANTGRPNSGGSQFFIVTGPSGVSLPPAYTAFGRVTEGMDVVNHISLDGAPPYDPTGSGIPLVTHKIIRMTITP